MKVKENLHQEKPDDVYDLIRSPEVREYFRENANFDIFEKVQIVLHSYISVQQKADMLWKLLHTADKKQAGRIYKMYRFFTGHIEYIHHPPVRTVFLLEIGYVW